MLGIQRGAVEYSERGKRQKPWEVIEALTALGKDPEWWEYERNICYNRRQSMVVGTRVVRKAKRA